MSNTTSVSYTLTMDATYTLRSMFYLLTPNETYFENVNQVPKLFSKATNIFFGLIIIENFLAYLKSGSLCLRVNDGITSVANGVLSRLPDLFLRSIHLIAYEYFYEKFCLYTLPWNSFYTYLVAFILFDLGYYWFHRMAHEVNLFWAAHQVHHSSEDYNLTSALRQSVFQAFTSWMFYLPMALIGVPPSIFCIHNYMNILYQFWIHTELIQSLGPLELILNTPSHHRVHHGRNPYCIDKNYGGVLIIWDRLFGTFEQERDHEKIAYGLVHNIHTFDPIYIQIFHFKYIFERFLHAPTLSEKVSILFKGPGWMPGLSRLGDYKMIPEIESNIHKYNPQVSKALVFYMLYQFYVIVHVVSCIIESPNGYNPLHLSLMVILFVYSLWTIGAVFDKRPNSIQLECLRCLFWIVFDMLNSHLLFKHVFKSHEIIYFAFKATNILSFLAFSSTLGILKTKND